MRRRAMIQFHCNDRQAEEIVARMPTLERFLEDGYRSECFVDSNEYGILLQLLEQLDIEYIRITAPFFEEEELDAASYFTFCGWNHFAYPQPERNNGYLNASFDMSRACRVCLHGAVQDRPLIVYNFPKNREYFSLHWVEELVVSERLAALFQGSRLTGFELWPVLLGRSKKSAKETSWKQLRMVNVMPPLAPETPLLEAEDNRTCNKCLRESKDIDCVAWYHQKSLGRAQDFNVTEEWLGLGGVHRVPIVSQKAYRFFRQNMPDVGVFYPVTII